MEGSKAARDLRNHLMWTYLFRQATLYPSKETMALHIQNILRHTKSMILLPGSFSCWSHLWPKRDSTFYLHFLLLIFKPICLHLPFRDLWKHSSPVKIRQNQKHLLKIFLSFFWLSESYISNDHYFLLFPSLSFPFKLQISKHIECTNDTYKLPIPDIYYYS